DLDLGGGEADKVAPLGVGSPLAVVYGVETPRGYNPLDVRHYREFLGFVNGRDEPVLALSPFAQPIIPNYDVEHRRLYELLNIRFLIYPAGAPASPERWSLTAADPGPPLVPAIPAVLSPEFVQPSGRLI